MYRQTLGIPMGTNRAPLVADLFVLGFYDPVNNEIMSSRSFSSGSVPVQAYVSPYINHSAVYILFWSFEISNNILRNQK